MTEREFTRRSFLEMAAYAVGALALGSVPEAYAGDKKSKTSQKNESPRNISTRGIDFIKQYEDFRPNVYDPIPNDGKPEPTIGYGHLIKPGEKYTSITREDAEKLLRKDLEIHQEPIRKYVKVKLTQNQYDALTSLVYNIGEGAFKDSKLLKNLNKGKYDDAANEFLNWNQSKKKIVPGLTKRRKKERELFLKK